MAAFTVFQSFQSSFCEGFSYVCIGIVNCS